MTDIQSNLIRLHSICNWLGNIKDPLMKLVSVMGANYFVNYDTQKNEKILLIKCVCKELYNNLYDY